MSTTNNILRDIKDKKTQQKHWLLLSCIGVVSFIVSRQTQAGMMAPMARLEDNLLVNSRSLMVATQEEPKDDQSDVQEVKEKEQVHHAPDDTDTVQYQSNLLQEKRFKLNDPTMRLSPYVDRPWLKYHSDIFPASENVTKPKRKLILTDFGWNHPNWKIGLSNCTRSLRMRELLQAYIDHPDFDPTFSWTEMIRGKVPIDTSLEYVVLMDIETCFESNFPFNGGNYDPNADVQMGRVITPKGNSPCYRMNGCGEHIQHVLRAPLFRQVNDTTLLYPYCGGTGPDKPMRETIYPSNQLAVVAVSAAIGELKEDSADMGMPPPALNPVTLSDQQRQAIHSCESESNEQRPYLLTFVGSGRQDSPRDELFKLHNGADVLIYPTRKYHDHKRKRLTNETFGSLLYKTHFGATPRGDNLFSYRFTEVLSAGAIPVVHSDGWVLPFRKELVDWSQCAVVIPEVQMNQTLSILKNFTETERCKMRQYCYGIYQKYMVNPEANIAGMLDSIDAARRGRENQFLFEKSLS